MKEQFTKEQKAAISKAAPLAAANVTDSPFWTEVFQHLETNHQERQKQIEPRKLKGNR